MDLGKGTLFFSQKHGCFMNTGISKTTTEKVVSSSLLAGSLDRIMNKLKGSFKFLVLSWKRVGRIQNTGKWGSLSNFSGRRFKKSEGKRCNTIKKHWLTRCLGPSLPFRAQWVFEGLQSHKPLQLSHDTCPFNMQIDNGKLRCELLTYSLLAGP